MAEFTQASHKLRVTTRGKGFIGITEELRRWLRGISAGNGLLTVSSAIPPRRSPPKRTPIPMYGAT